MKQITGNYTNTEVTTGRDLGAAKNNPGDNTGTGADKEIFNDPFYGFAGTIQSYKEGGISDTDETLTDNDMRDALEEMTAKKVSTVDEWSSSTTYTTPQLVMRKGFQFYAYNTTGNLSKDPLLFPDYWYYSGTPEELMKCYNSGEVLGGELNPIADRSNGNYAQSALIGKYRLGGNGDTFYNFYRVALDGTQVTGNANLEAILGSYWNLDVIAPVNLGARTLIDMSSRHVVPQSNGGDNDVLGGVLKDRVQGHWHEIQTQSQSGGVLVQRTGTLGTQLDTGLVQDPISDGVNGTPRTGSTTRPKEFTVGSSYIIVMVAA